MAVRDDDARGFKAPLNTEDGGTTFCSLQPIGPGKAGDTLLPGPGYYHVTLLGATLDAVVAVRMYPSDTKTGTIPFSDLTPPTNNDTAAQMQVGMPLVRLMIIFVKEDELRVAMALLGGKGGPTAYLTRVFC